MIASRSFLSLFFFIYQRSRVGSVGGAGSKRYIVIALYSNLALLALAGYVGISTYGYHALLVRVSVMLVLGYAR